MDEGSKQGIEDRKVIALLIRAWAVITYEEMLNTWSALKAEWRKQDG
jgi:hypothetical protein